MTVSEFSLLASLVLEVAEGGHMTETTLERGLFTLAVLICGGISSVDVLGTSAGSLSELVTSEGVGRIHGVTPSFSDIDGVFKGEVWLRLEIVDA